MGPSNVAATATRPQGSRPGPEARPVRRRIAIVVGSIVVLAIGCGIWWSAIGVGRGRTGRGDAVVDGPEARSHPAPPKPPGTEVVQLTEEQQRAIGLRTARVKSGPAHDVVSAPGRVAPNESQFAYITPRAAGVVRSVTAHVGQDVKAGDLLATIDSPEVGQARLALYTELQSLEIARAQADWQETIYQSTLDLLDRLRKGKTPEQIHNDFQERALGENREKLMTAYAQYRLALATIARNRELFADKLITAKQFEKVQADFEVAQASYQSLMDQMGYEARLANTRAHQALKQAETSVRAARERLRILGVKPDGTEPDVQGGKVVGVKPDGTLPASTKDDATAEKPETILAEKGEKAADVKPVGAEPDKAAKPKESPVSTYSIWAPFDGTILERELIVPGVAVDTTHRIFTMANLATVWVEASIHESDFDELTRSQGGRIRFRTPAYPAKVFEGRVIYSGDLVDEKSRTVKLLAQAENPGRLLKPGMFVEVEVLTPRDYQAYLVPSAALLTHEDRSFVYVRIGPDRFARREVDVESPRGESAAVRNGIEPGEEVVVEGAFQLKSLAFQLASEES